MKPGDLVRIGKGQYTGREGFIYRVDGNFVEVRIKHSRLVATCHTSWLEVLDGEETDIAGTDPSG